MNRDTAIIIALALIAFTSGLASFRAWAMLLHDRRLRRLGGPAQAAAHQGADEWAFGKTRDRRARRLEVTRKRQN